MNITTKIRKNKVFQIYLKLDDKRMASFWVSISILLQDYNPLFDSLLLDSFDTSG